MRRELTDFSSPERMENEGILYVFPVFHIAGKKIRCSADAELFRVSLYFFIPAGVHSGKTAFTGFLVLMAQA